MEICKNPAGILGEGSTVNNCYNSRTPSLFTSEVLVVGPISCTVSLKKNTKDRKKAWKEQRHFCKDLAGNLSMLILYFNLESTISFMKSKLFGQF